MDMFRAYVIRKKLEEEKKETKDKIKKGELKEKEREIKEKEKVVMKCGPWEEMLEEAEKKLEEENKLKEKNNIKIVCGICGQQQYFCACPRNLYSHTAPP
jgi:hypothetical protein